MSANILEFQRQRVLRLIETVEGNYREIIERGGIEKFNEFEERFFAMLSEPGWTVFRKPGETYFELLFRLLKEVYGREKGLQELRWICKILQDLSLRFGY